MGRKIAVFRKEHFNAAHRLFNPSWAMEENDRVFGKCNNPNFHGHNYELVVKVTGEPDEQTGYVMDMKVLGDLIKENVLKQFVIVPVPVFIGTHAKHLVVLFLRPCRVVKFVCRIKVFHTGEIHHPVKISMLMWIS